MSEIIKKLVEKSKSMVLISVVSTLISSATAYLWGFVKTISFILNFITNRGNPLGVIPLLEVMDIFLIATVLLIFSMGVYELFIGTIVTPDWLVIRNLHDLKVKLSSVIVLVMGIIFLEHLAAWKDPNGTLLFGISVTLVSIALIAFSYIGGKTD